MSDFFFCPYCGFELKNNDDLESSIAGPFEEMEKLQAENCLERLEKLSTVLGRLEDEINEIINLKIENKR